MSALRAAAVAGAVLALAGCGGSGGGGGGALPDGAARAPADAPAFTALDTTDKSWDKTLALARRFPAFTSAVSETELDQVKAAVGPEVDLVWLDFQNGGDNVVGLTKPSSVAKLKAALGADVATAEVSDGWLAFGSSQALVDRFKERATGDKLADQDDFKDAFGSLASDASARAWVDGPVVQEALDRSLATGGAAPQITHEIGTLKALAASATAESDGVSVDANGFIDPNPDPRTFSPSLPAATPAGAVQYLGAVGLDDATRIVLDMVARSKPKFESQLSQVEGVLGLTLKDDVYPLIHDESGLAIYPGGQIPPILFLQKVSDEGKAESLIRRIAAIARLAGEVGVDTVEINGVTVQKLTFSGDVTIWYGVTKGKIITTNSERLVREAIGGPTETLADEQLYKSARDAAKLPDKVTAFTYSDLERGLPFVFDLAERNGSVIPPEARENTKPLHATMLYLVPDGDHLRLSGFATIK